MAKIGSPGVRLALAKIYTQPSTPAGHACGDRKGHSSPRPCELRRASRSLSRCRNARNAQVDLEKDLVKQNEAAVKAAPQAATDEKGKPAATGGSPFSPTVGSRKARRSPASSGGGLFRRGGQAVWRRIVEPSPAAESRSAAWPQSRRPRYRRLSANVQKRMEAAARRDAGGRTQARRRRVLAGRDDSGDLRRSSKQAADRLRTRRQGACGCRNSRFRWPTACPMDKGNAEHHRQRVGLPPHEDVLARKAQGSIAQTAGERPSRVGQDGAGLAAEGGLARTAGNRRRGKGKRDGASGTRRRVLAARAQVSEWGRRIRLDNKKLEVAEFGTEWFDPGSLVVLKSIIPYLRASGGKDDASHDASAAGAASHVAAMEKRMADKAEKQKVLEASVRVARCHREGRPPMGRALAAVAEEPPSAGDKAAAADDDKSDAAAAKPAKSASSSASNVSKSSGTRPRLSRIRRRRPSRCHLAMFAGETIAKEYHQRWPQDLSANLGSSAPTAEPLAFDYVRLEEKGQSSQDAHTLYRAITSLPGTKPRIFRRKIENGTWLDSVQKDETSHRTRSIDIIVTKEAVGRRFQEVGRCSGHGRNPPRRDRNARRATCCPVTARKSPRKRPARRLREPKSWSTRNEIASESSRRPAATSN